MNAERIQLTGEKETLLGTLYLRALDSRSADPILGDASSEAAVRRIDYDFGRLRVGPNHAIGIAVRARLLDDWTREFLAAHPAATVLHLGCGLDGRVYRVDPPDGVRWFDVDYPEVVELRRRLYPARAGYRMIGSSVTDPGWLDEVAHDGPVLVVAEGVLMYLAEPEVEPLLRRITTRFAGGQMAFDASSRRGLRIRRVSSVIRRTGATLGWGLDDPRALERSIPGLRLLTQLTAADLLDQSTLARFSRPVRLQLRLVNRLPPLRRLGWVLRYRF
jgi:O-methyltransferase involved in polyketide biosynthesis